MICNLTGATEVNYPDVKAEKTWRNCSTWPYLHCSHWMHCHLVTCFETCRLKKKIQLKDREASPHVRRRDEKMENNCFVPILCVCWGNWRVRVGEGGGDCPCWLITAQIWGKGHSQSSWSGVLRFELSLSAARPCLLQPPGHHHSHPLRGRRWPPRCGEQQPLQSSQQTLRRRNSSGRR